MALSLSGTVHDTRAQVAQQVHDRHWRAWMGLPGVVGLAVNTRAAEPCIVVWLAEYQRSTADAIRAQAEGVPIRVESSGRYVAAARSKIRALGAWWKRAQRF